MVLLAMVSGYGMTRYILDVTAKVSDSGRLAVFLTLEKSFRQAVAGMPADQRLGFVLGGGAEKYGNYAFYYLAQYSSAPRVLVPVSLPIKSSDALPRYTLVFFGSDVAMRGFVAANQLSVVNNPSPGIALVERRAQ